MSYTPITLEQLSGIAYEVPFNEVTAALAKAAIFGVKQRQTQGLKFTVYGGRFPTDSGPLAIADQTLTLTASATNYIYADNVGIIHKVTSAPSGWPGPLASSARALYQLTVGANSITSGTCWNIGIGGVGPVGATGATGAAGNELWLQRKRILSPSGFGSSNWNLLGFDDAIVGGGGPPGSVPASSSTFIGQVNGLNFVTGTTAANASGGRRTTTNFCTLGNAAGRGGFDFSMRFGVNSTAANTRSFYGLFDVSGGDPSASVDPSALVNMIGVGGDQGDANLSFMVNDGTGTATKTALGNNFPQWAGAAPNKVYELALSATANASSVAWTITEVDSGNTASGTASSNLPAGTTFLGWLAYVNTGAGGAQPGFHLEQVVANSRY